MLRLSRRLSWRFCVATFLPVLGGCSDPPANSDTGDTTGDTTGVGSEAGVDTMSTSSPSTTNTSNTSPSTTGATDTATDPTTNDTTGGGSESTFGVSEVDSDTTTSTSSPVTESSAEDSTTGKETSTTFGPTTDTESATSIGSTFDPTVFDFTTSSSSEGGMESTGMLDPEGDDDGDGFLNGVDNCPGVENPDQSDIDADDRGDWCDDEIIDDAERLYVPRDTDYELFGSHCYVGEVRIYGTLDVTPMSAAMGGGTLTIAAGLRLWVAEGGRIRAVGAGYAGGERSAGVTIGGFAGEGVGAGCGGGPGNSVANGGSGGGYGGAGGPPSLVNPFMLPCDFCSEATIAHCAGVVGAASGTQDGEDVDFGSGGGAGGNSSGCSNTGGIGGAGGGIIILISEETVRVDGFVRATGEHPPMDMSACGYHPGGGGGSGGTVVLAAPAIEGDAGGEITAVGGRGGNSPGMASDWGWAGGGGGGGRIKLFGDTTGFLGITSAAGGLGGPAIPSFNSYDGEPGEVGTVGGDTEIPVIWADFACD